MGFFAPLKARPHSQEVDGQANVSKVPALQGRKASSISSQLHQVNRLPVDYPCGLLNSELANRSIG
jgi:hypothetical protein